jgi:hypothetical protein
MRFVSDRNASGSSMHRVFFFMLRLTGPRQLLFGPNFFPPPNFTVSEGYTRGARYVFVLQGAL